MPETRRPRWPGCFPVPPGLSARSATVSALNFPVPTIKGRLFLHETYPPDFHPLLKSFSNQPIDDSQNVTAEEEYGSKKRLGKAVYQIPVGPVHAGIIEPGHFRFSVIGETIFNLEIRMFYKHRGIEKLAEGNEPGRMC